MEFKGVNKKLRVSHYAQIPCPPFIIEVKDEEEAAKVSLFIAYQHIFLYSLRVIPDYCNVITVSMYDESTDEWEDYYNEDLDMEWGEVCDTFFEKKIQENSNLNQNFNT